MKIAPCPTCGNTDVAVYTYDSKWSYVECDRCHYFGPGEGTKKQAVQSHNERALECPTCRGSGFSGRGSGYDDVCSECGGQKYTADPHP